MRSHNFQLPIPSTRSLSEIYAASRMELESLDPFGLERGEVVRGVAAEALPNTPLILR